MAISSRQIKELLINTFEIEMKPEEIPDEIRIIGEGLELDSVDVLEIVSQLDKQFKVRIKNSDIKVAAFGSVGILTEFVNTYAMTANAPPSDTVH